MYIASLRILSIILVTQQSILLHSLTLEIKQKITKTQHKSNKSPLSIMSTTKIAVAALAGAGAVLAVNKFTKPSKAHSIASGMRLQLDDYNATVHPDQDSW